ncbi:TonB-dependent receptor [Mucilaginibacter sp.]|jgi:TonB-linked SusC/RagA family outer membrane protein|uniref:SusC/RagA family TonB-linked outer membrane protein n=1 Tax=Mucilaginibacter sp. TaxID=1882438 RepID=UPI002D0A2B3E|nr:TonB-dependent receptor [Mucilaginibacter sp.]HTI58132.1 TonB-dependent receptor [Mucilaginibacter sp.]
MIKKLRIIHVVTLVGLCLSLLLVSSPGFAQSNTVKGTVTDGDSGSPLPGVTITVKGSRATTVSDVNGHYSIAAAANGTLVFVYIGYATQEVPVGGRAVVDVKMATDNKALSEVVVVGYGTAKRKDLTGSVSSVTAAQIASVPVTTLDQALQGRAAGVQVVSNDASPGGNISVLIRGIGSLASGGNGPLYVVDGYPLDGSINNINPSDIASIDVLKDASATAIYGIRAANGVVIVTTKKGRKDGVQVSFDAYNAFQSKPKEYNILNAQQWATLANEVADADPQHNFAELQQWRTPASLTNADWQNAMYRTAQTQSYSLAIRGGSEKVQSATSLGYYDQKGIVLGSYFKRVTLGSNVDYSPMKWLKSSTSAKYTYQDSNNPFGTGSLVQLTQLPPTLDGGNKQTSLIKDNNNNYGFYNPQNTYVAKYGNPVFTVENDRYQNLTNFLLANTSLEATIIDGLKIKTNAGVNVNEYNGYFFQPEDDRLDQQYNLGGATQNAFYSQHLNQTFNWLWENTISYDKTFGKHTINFVGGVSEQKNTYTAMGGSGIPPNSVIRDLGQVRNLQLDALGNGQSIYSLASQFARLSYSFNDRYLITGTIRRDGSSKFDAGHQYGTFPSGAVAWKAKEESFLKNVDWLSDLKIRASYGEVGNQGSIGLFQYQALYSTGSAPATSGNLGYPFDKLYQGGIASVQPSNPDLKWETDTQTDIGADISFLHGDLTVTVDWFDRKSKDFLLTLAAPAQTGYNFLTRNVGSMENKGFEFAINYNHRTSEFKYGVGLTLTTVSNKLTSITSGTNFVTNFGGLSLAGIGWSTFTETNVGQPVGEFYGYKTLGIFQTQAQVDALNASAAAKNPSNPYYQKTATGPGDRYFADTNGDGQVTPADQVSLGSPIPKFYGGLNFDFSYRAWDFNAYFYGVYGNKILNYEESSLESFQNRSFVGVENVSYDYYLHHWTSTNPSNIYARANYNDDAIGSNVPSSSWIQNGSFLKLKNVTVGYTLPSDLVSKASLAKVRVYFSTQNLFTITSYKGLDPEVGMQGGNATQNGVDNGTYPSSRFYTIGLNVTFK